MSDDKLCLMTADLELTLWPGVLPLLLLGCCLLGLRPPDQGGQHAATAAAVLTALSDRNQPFAINSFASEQS